MWGVASRSFAASAMVTVALGCGSEPVVGMDAGGARDAGVGRDSATTPPDAGPGPECTGTPEDCGTRTAAECVGVQGCELGTCEPGVTSRACFLERTPAECEALMGCFWDEAGECTGSALECGRHQSEALCESQQCNWSTFGAAEVCRGTPTRCTDLDAATCAMQPGCRPAAGVDAGAPSDAGPGDAGLDAGTDAGRSCSVSGACHPLYDTGCRCGYSDSDFRWGCGRGGSRGEGGGCDTSADCAVGLFCPRTTNNGAGSCRRFCDEDADCRAGEGCAAIDEIPGAPCAGYCLPLAECGLRAQDCGGRACYWLRDPASGRDHVFCNPEGAGAAGDLCHGDPTACEAGLVCVTSITGSSRCQPICASDADCASSTRRTCGGMAPGAMFCN